MSAGRRMLVRLLSSAGILSCGLAWAGPAGPRLPQHVAHASIAILAGAGLGVAVQRIRRSRWYHDWYRRNFGPLDQY